MRGRLKGLVGERVVLQTKDEKSLRGVLVGVHNDCVTISNVEYLHQGKADELPGEALVLLGNLSWLHRLAVTA